MFPEDPAGAAARHAQPDDDRDCAPPLDGRRRRPDLGAAGRAHRGAGQARRPPG